MTSALRGLTGAPGSGKTAVVDRLRSSVRCVDEPARRVLAEQRASGGAGTPERDAARFVELLLELAMMDHREASVATGPVLFDRGVPDCIVYANHLEVDPRRSEAAAERYRYHEEVLLFEPSEDIYATDEERTMEFADSVVLHEMLVEGYVRTGYRLVTVPRGSDEDRAAFVKGRLLGRSPQHS